MIVSFVTCHVSLVTTETQRVRRKKTLRFCAFARMYNCLNLLTRFVFEKNYNLIDHKASVQ